MRDDVEPHENFMRGWEDYKVILDTELWLVRVWQYWAVIGQSEAILTCDWSGCGNTKLWLVARSASGTLTVSSGWGTSWCGRWPTSTTTLRTSWRWTWRTGPATGGSHGTGPSDSAASATPSGCITRTSTTATLETPCTGGHKIFNAVLKNIFNLFSCNTPSRNLLPGK